MSTLKLLVNIDVADLRSAERFYCAAFSLRPGRRFDGAVELWGAEVALYLLEKAENSEAAPPPTLPRNYERHWTPVHLDFVVEDLEAALVRARAAGAKLEKAIASHPWGRIALLADPFGNGFCLLEFSASGYDAIAL